jgi:hypothetical protein
MMHSMTVRTDFRCMTLLLNKQLQLCKIVSWIGHNVTCLLFASWWSCRESELRRQESDCVYLSSIGVAAKFRTITVTALQRLPNIATATPPRITVVPAITESSRINNDALTKWRTHGSIPGDVMPTVAQTQWYVPKKFSCRIRACTKHHQYCWKPVNFLDSPQLNNQ